MKLKKVFSVSSVACIGLMLLIASCSGTVKEDKTAEHKPDSLVIRDVVDTAYTPSDTSNPSSALVPKLVYRKDTIRIKR